MMLGCSSSILEDFCYRTSKRMGLRDTLHQWGVPFLPHIPTPCLPPCYVAGYSELPNSCGFSQPYGCLKGMLSSKRFSRTLSPLFALLLKNIRMLKKLAAHGHNPNQPTFGDKLCPSTILLCHAKQCVTFRGRKKLHIITVCSCCCTEGKQKQQGYRHAQTHSLQSLFQENGIM